MDTELENEESYEQLGKKRKRSWQRKLLRWTWIIVSTVVWVTFKIAVGILWAIAVLVLGFFGGMATADTSKIYREVRRTRGDYSQG